MIKKFVPKNKLILLVYILGTLIVLYPLVSNLYSKNVQNNVVREYEKSVVTRDQERNQKQIDEMRQHNSELVDQQATLTGADFGIDAELGSEDKKLGEVLGIVEIPKINVELPIYYGTNERQISEGAGVMNETSLPVGGESTHSVITSHRGLPTAKLFTDLPKLEKGDIFFIKTAGEVLAYEVDQIKVIKPEDFSDLEIIDGKDMVTLLTCTPYLINTHRLLVRGQRVAYSENLKLEATNKGLWERMKTILLWFSLLLLLVLVLYLLNRYFKKRRAARERKIKAAKRKKVDLLTAEQAKPKRKKTALTNKKTRHREKPELGKNAFKEEGGRKIKNTEEAGRRKIEGGK